MYNSFVNNIADIHLSETYWKLKRDYYMTLLPKIFCKQI